MTTTPSTTVPTTTGRVCDEDMDEYGPVDVNRFNEDGSPIDIVDGWTPGIASDNLQPYSGSHVKLTFSRAIKLTSVLVAVSSGSDETVKVAFKIKYRGVNTFTEVTNPDDGSKVFSSHLGRKIPLPDDTLPGVEIEVYVVGTLPNFPVHLTPFGCEHPGK